MVSAGSTPTVAFSTGGVITEIRPGEYVFCDLDNTRLGACAEDQIALFVAATVVSDWVPDQAILDVGTKALGREGNPEQGLRRSRRLEGASWPSSTSTTGSSPFPAGEHRPPVGTVVPVVPNHVCPVVNSFEELVVTDSEGTSVQRWPVAARGLLS